ncbi:DUF1120 domain-containing protein [Pectobacterium punjabense]|uniref:DUF1120 domain-containing protein n=1 Tax=Pectobacterium punjabense TaxID=2108399 RepID=UPI0032EDFBEC
MAGKFLLVLLINKHEEVIMMMMNTVTKTACALAVLAATSTSVMAESIDVRVIGTITPTACKPTLSGGGTIDYGVISPASLKKDTVTVLAEKQVDFSITCDAPAKVAVNAIGTKSDTATDVKGTGGYPYFIGGKLFGAVNPNVTGLGADGGKNIGGYGIRLVPDTFTLDGNKAINIFRESPDHAWIKPVDEGILLTWNKKSQTSWSNKSGGNPVAFKMVAGKLGVQAYITKTSELDLSKPVKLDGLTTLEMHYL